MALGPDCWTGDGLGGKFDDFVPGDSASRKPFTCSLVTGPSLVTVYTEVTIDRTQLLTGITHHGDLQARSIWEMPFGPRVQTVLRCKIDQ